MGSWIWIQIATAYVLELFHDMRVYDAIELLFHVIKFAPAYSEAYANILNEVNYPV